MDLNDEEYCHEMLEDTSDLPDAGDDEEVEGERRNRENILSIRLRDAHRASLKAPAGEILHDPDAAPLVRTEHDVVLAFLGLDPDSEHPRCDWCEEEERHGLKPEAHGRWFMHLDCYVDAEEWRDDQGQPLLSLRLPAREWEWDEQSPAPVCNVRSKPRPPALTEEQLAEVVTLRQWKFNQTQIAEKLGVNPATVSRALRKAEERGVRPGKLRGEQLSIVDWFGEEAV